MKTPVEQDAHAARVQPADANGGDPFALAPWLKQMPDVPLHPLMAHPMAAMAAVTAVGFGIAGQMAGTMLGLMQSAADQAEAALDEVAPKPEEPVKAKPVLTVVPKAAGAERPARTVVTAAARGKSVMPKTKIADDLKAISGVGPKLEQVLNGMGFRRYADIAGLKPADVDRIEAELGFAGRIARDGWVEQAKALAKGRG